MVKNGTGLVLHVRERTDTLLHRELNTLDIDHLCHQFKFYRGCVPDDVFAKQFKPRQKAYWVINYEGSGQKGSHWVVVDSVNKVAFDPLGETPDETVRKVLPKSYIYNESPVQIDTTHYCGHWCVFYIAKEHFPWARTLWNRVKGGGDNRRLVEKFMAKYTAGQAQSGGKLGKSYWERMPEHTFKATIKERMAIIARALHRITSRLAVLLQVDEDDMEEYEEEVERLLYYAHVQRARLDLLDQIILTVPNLSLPAVINDNLARLRRTANTAINNAQHLHIGEPVPEIEVSEDLFDDAQYHRY